MIFKIQETMGADKVDPDEAAHHELPHLGQHCLRIIFILATFSVKIAFY